MSRAYYSGSVEKFLSDESDLILGELTRHHQFSLEDLQRNAWISQINILQSELRQLPSSYIAFEYAIPRMGKRVDVIILYAGLIFVLEFKVGEKGYSHSAMEQALDYSIDLKNFHEQSHFREIVPLVVATEAPSQDFFIQKYPDGVYYPIKSNKSNIVSTVLEAPQPGAPASILQVTLRQSLNASNSGKGTGLSTCSC